MEKRSRSFQADSFPCTYSEVRVGFEERGKSYSFNGNGPSSENPEMKRRKRVASYNMFSMEGKLKSSLRNSFKWIKSKFSDHDHYFVDSNSS